MGLFDAFSYNGKRAVVVGGATGMGAAVAELRRALLSIEAFGGVDANRARVPCDRGITSAPGDGHGLR